MSNKNNPQARADKVMLQRERMFRYQLGKCFVCGRIHRSHSDMELAHHVANTETNVKVYGKERIDHDLNKALVCREKWAGKDCNASCNMGNKPASADALMAEIAERIELAKGEVLW